jgi:predicted acylesterase/phospholipase RssA
VTEQIAVKKQIRIALVMNGGVSLAVWMGGVAHEIDLLRRASMGASPPADPCERSVFDAWKALADKLQIDVVVDTIAGTSAGGLNGTLLATATARGVPLDGLKAVWLKTGSLRRETLLPAAGSTPVPSLLDGGFFQDEVDRVLGDFKQSEAEARDVTLFVTATALDSPDGQYVDTYGAAFDVPDHRRLYRFRKRNSPCSYSIQDGQASFTDDNPDDDFATVGTGSALARAARASASFPLAFEPVREIPAMTAPIRQGTLPAENLAWLMDGGVLDNAPFGPLLKEIARRPVTGPWHRVICYVVPSSGQITPKRQAPSPLPDPDRQPPWTAIVAKTVAFPREADLREDVEQLTALLQQSGEDGQALLDRLLKLNPQPNEQVVVAEQLWSCAQGMFPLYREARAATGVWDALLEASAARKASYLSPPASLRGAEILPLLPAWVPSEIDAPLDQWTWGLAGADRAVRIMLRSLRTLALVPLPVATETFTTVDGALRKIEAVSEHFTHGLLAQLGPLLPAGADELPVTAVVPVINTLMDELHVPDVLGGLVQSAVDAYAAATSRTASQVWQALRLVEVMTVTTAGWEPYGRAPRFDFARLGPDVPSPLFAGSATGDKLYGTRLGHFGAFGKEDWRVWDWTWGRLDGAAHLVRILCNGALPPDEVQQEVLSLQNLILACERPSEDPATEQTAMQGQLDVALCAKNADLLRELRSDRDGRRSMSTLVETVLRFAWGDDQIPRPVRMVGRGANAALAQHLAGKLSRWGWALRIGAVRRRGRLWRYLGDPFKK